MTTFALGVSLVLNAGLWLALAGSVRERRRLIWDLARSARRADLLRLEAEHYHDAYQVARAEAGR